MDRIEAHLKARAEYEARHASQIARQRRYEENILAKARAIRAAKEADALMRSIRAKKQEAMLRD